MSKTSLTVAILWRDPGDDPSIIKTLVYGDGECRTYRRDAVDSRVGEFTFLDNEETIIKNLAKSNGTKYAVPVAIAKNLLDNTFFSED